jgi:pimeloyl-ACP methyl ester carboxylesterase
MAMADESFSDFYYSSTDGLKLHARIYGEEANGALPVVCLPGLTRNARDFHELALHLSRGAMAPRKVVAFDFRGRGGSAYDREWQNYNIGVEAGDIVAGLIALGIEHAAFIGTSRGGLIIHVLAATRPGALKAVVLNDIGPVVEGEGFAHIRAYLERAPKPASFAEAVAVQRGTHSQAFSALGDRDWERMVRALYRDEDGKPVADFDPVRWPQFDGLAGVPMLAIRGENSKLLSARTLEEMARRHPRIETILVEGQGHAPMLETGELPQRIEAFLDQVDPLFPGRVDLAVARRLQ